MFKHKVNHHIKKSTLDKQQKKAIIQEALEGIKARREAAQAHIQPSQHGQETQAKDPSDEPFTHDQAVRSIVTPIIQGSAVVTAAGSNIVGKVIGGFGFGASDDSSSAEAAGSSSSGDASSSGKNLLTGKFSFPGKKGGFGK